MGELAEPEEDLNYMDADMADGHQMSNGKSTAHQYAEQLFGVRQNQVR